MMYRQITVVLLAMVCAVGVGQISHGGQPVQEVSAIDAIQLKLEMQPKAFSSETESNAVLPMRFAEPIYTNLTPQNSGVWEEGEDGINVWRLSLRSSGAKSLNLIFDQFHLKDGDRLFVYNPQRTHVLGGFTQANNNPSGLFAIAPIAGDEIIVELQTEASINANHEITISAVNHDYKGVISELKRSIDFDLSGECNVDVICEELNSTEINRSVCKFIVDGTALCSGTMLNNTSQDGTPYFLSAAHCFYNPTDGSGNLTAQNVVFYFNYESPNCSPIIESTDAQTLSGAHLKAYVENMDFALLQMDKMPPAKYRPYWAGWTLDQSILNEVFSVHHPSGDVKKVSISQGAPTKVTYDISSPEGVPFLPNVHWLIARWAKGTTEQGSSGSGLFTKDQLLIGSLSGGRAYCGNSVEDYFSRFHEAWKKNGNADAQLAHWIDSKGTGVNQLGGFDYYNNSTVRLSAKAKDDGIEVKYDNQFKGSWSGHNARGYTAFANYYYDISKATLEGIYLMPAISDRASTQTVNVKVWDGSTGEPGSVLWYKDNIAISSLPAAKEALINMEPALILTKPFFVGVELNYINPVDTFALYQLAAPSALLNPSNRAYIRNNTGEWSGFNQLHSSASRGAYWIDLLIKDGDITTDTGDVDVTDHYLKILNNPVLNGGISFETNIENLKLAEIYAVNGHLAKQTTINSSNRISVRGLAPGLYIVKFTSLKQSIVKRVIIAQ